MDPSARSTAAPPSPAPLSQSRPSLSRSALTTAAPIQGLGQHGQQRQLLPQVWHQVQSPGVNVRIYFQQPIVIAEFQTVHREIGSSAELRPSLTSSPGLSPSAWDVEGP